MNLYHNERISRSFLILKPCLFEIISTSFKSESSDIQNSKLQEAFQKIEISNKNEKLFISLTEEYFNKNSSRMNTFTLLNLMLMQPIFEVIQRTCKRDSVDIHPNHFLELIDIWKKWSQEDIDFLGENYCKHALFCILMFLDRFNFNKQFSQLYSDNVDFLKCKRVGKKIIEEVDESYFGDEDEPSQEIFKKEVDPISIEKLIENDLQQKNEKDEKKSLTVVYQVHRIQDIERDFVDFMIKNAHDNSVMIKNFLKRFLNLPETPRSIFQRSIVGVKREHIVFEDSKIDEEMKILQNKIFN
jgi:hypothetical protein